ncbi:MAG: cupin domain-containing protein [Balneolaceae bacterium]|nr:cupin domain-containing protein [Balneolaceae bacterium]
MKYEPIDLSKKFELFDEYWTPKLIAESNNQLVKLAKLKGELVWHTHEKEDELFFIVKGKLKLKFRDGEVVLKTGELFVVPAGKEHLPIALEESWVMLIEPASTLHTGDINEQRTVGIDEQEWI